MLRLLRDSFHQFIADECPRLAASLAYYAIFSLPPLLALVIGIAGMVAGRDLVAQRATYFFQELMGQGVAEQIGGMLKHSSISDHGVLASIVGIVVLMVGATGVLAELQTALNRAWHVQPDPKQGGLRSFAMKRLLSLGIVVGMVVLLLASLIISWLLAALSTLAEAEAPGWISPIMLRWVDQFASLGIMTLLFAGVFKYVPDVRLDWTDVWAGAVLTAFLFVAGKVGLGMYLAWSDPTSAFGATGSLALVLVWIYYSGLIFFFGAEFTHNYARSRGRHAAPEPGAKKEEAHRE